MQFYSFEFIFIQNHRHSCSLLCIAHISVCNKTVVLLMLLELSLVAEHSAYSGYKWALYICKELITSHSERFTFLSK